MTAAKALDFVGRRPAGRPPPPAATAVATPLFVTCTIGPVKRFASQNEAATPRTDEYCRVQCPAGSAATGKIGARLRAMTPLSTGYTSVPIVIRLKAHWPISGKHPFSSETASPRSHACRAIASRQEGERSRSATSISTGTSLAGEGSEY